MPSGDWPLVAPPVYNYHAAYDSERYIVATSEVIRNLAEAFGFAVKADAAPEGLAAIQSAIIAAADTIRERYKSE